MQVRGIWKYRPLRQELDNVNSSFAKLQQMVEDTHREQSNERDCDRSQGVRRKSSSRKGKSNVTSNDGQRQGNEEDGGSEVTIYHDAVLPKRVSSSSDDMVNTSDENMNLNDSGDKIESVLSQLKIANRQYQFAGDGRDPSQTRERHRDEYRSRDRGDDSDRNTTRADNRPPDWEGTAASG